MWCEDRRQRYECVQWKQAKAADQFVTYLGCDRTCLSWYCEVLCDLQLAYRTAEGWRTERDRLACLVCSSSWYDRGVTRLVIDTAERHV